MVKEIYSEKEIFLWVSTKKSCLLDGRMKFVIPTSVFHWEAHRLPLKLSALWTDQRKIFYSNSIIEHILNIWTMYLAMFFVLELVTVYYTRINSFGHI